MEKKICSKLIILTMTLALLFFFGISALVVNGESSVLGQNNKANTSDKLIANAQMASGYTMSIATPPADAVAINNSTELLAWLKDTTTAGYLVNDIPDWSKTAVNAKSSLNLTSGRTLFGNGKKITATINVNSVSYSSDAMFGYLVDINQGTIQDLTIETANNGGSADRVNSEPNCLRNKNGVLKVGVLSGENKGTIDNCVVNVKHVVKATWSSDSNWKWHDIYVGGVTGSNHTTSATNGIISNTTVNMEKGGALIASIYSDRQSPGIITYTSRALVAAVAGEGKTDNKDVASFKNITVNYNGGTLGVIQYDGTYAYNRFAVATVFALRPEDQNNAKSSICDGLIINGTPVWKRITGTNKAGDSKFNWWYTCANGNGTTEKANYISSTMTNSGTGSADDLAFDVPCYQIPDGNTARFVNDKVELTTNATYNNVTAIYSVTGKEVFAQQVNQLDNATRVVSFDKSQASALRANMAVVDNNIISVDASNLIADANIYIGSKLAFNDAPSDITANGITFASGIPTELTNSGEYICMLEGNLFLYDGTLNNAYSTSITSKTISIDKRIFLENAVDGASINNGILSISKRLDQISVKAVTSAYGMYFTGINGANMVSKIAANTYFIATLDINNDVTNLGLESAFIQKNVSINVVGNGTATVNEVVNGNFEASSELNFLATPSEGNVFLGWSDRNGRYLSVDEVYTAVMGINDIVINANFAESYNLILVNSQNHAVAKFNIANLGEFGVNDILSLDMLPISVLDAISTQTFNKLSSFCVKSISESGVITIKAMYNAATETVDVMIDGVATQFAVNEAIDLTAGEYLINGAKVSVSADKILSLRAIRGLTIISNTVEVGTETAVNGDFDEINSIININLVANIGYKTLSIEIYNADLDMVIATKNFVGRPVIADNKVVVQALVMIPQDVLEYVNLWSNIYFRVLVDGVSVGNIAR